MSRAALTGLLLLVVAGGALALRLPALSTRPMHTDEAIHAFKFEDLCRGDYRYDPADYHGPTLYALTFPAWWAEGAPSLAASSETTFRLAPAVIGALLVLLLWGLASGLGRGAVLAAGVLVAVSPAMVFYSRYYIQEVPLLFFTAGVLVAGWRYARRPGLGWALLAGACAGLMHATKETAALALAAMAVALACTWWAGRGRSVVAPRPRLLHVGLGVLTAVVVAVVVIAVASRDLAAPLESLRALALQGASGAHEQPWHYYLGLLLFHRSAPGPFWSEAFILALALVGLGVAWTGRGLGDGSRGFARFLAIYTILLTAAYALVPHKTPWSMLSFLSGLILLAGLGAAALLRRAPCRISRAVLALVLAAGAVHLGFQAWRGATRYAADPRNPYVYAQTVPDAVRLGKRVVELSTLHPDGAKMRVDVIAPGGDYWPLPWELRGLDRDRIGYWSEAPATLEAPVVTAAPVVIAAEALAASVAEKLPGDWHQNVFGLRPSVRLVLFVRQSLWDAFIRSVADAPAKSVHAITHRAMGTTFEVRIADLPETKARQAAEAAFEELDRLDAQLSHYRPTSDVSRIAGLGAGERMKVTLPVIECLGAAARFHRNTDGAFDVTVGPLMRCWQTEDRKPREPSSAELARARRHVGMRHLAIDREALEVGSTIRGVEVDLGGIGKGFALDRMAALLKEWGVTRARLHGGHSTVLALDAPPGRTGWTTVFADPDDAARTLATIDLANRAMAVSGLATRGRHIIDPRTGRAADRYRVVLVLAPTATAADALSTAFMVMSPDAIRAHCGDHPDVSALLVRAGAGADEVLRIGRW